MRFGGLEIIVIAGLVLLFWGPKQLPKLADAAKKSKDIMKKEKNDATNENTTDENE